MVRVRLLVFSLILLVLAPGCAARGRTASETFRKYGLRAAPEPGRFDVCVQFGCRGIASVSLDFLEWNSVAGIFLPRSENAAEERTRISRAVARMEVLAGAHAGTALDVAKNDQAGPGQIDCVAESVNTSVYLMMMQDRGLLAFHRVEPPSRRGTFIFYPHNTAVIRETASGREFAVDSWFEANGEPPYILPLAVWRSGWHPGDEADATFRDEGLSATTEAELGL